MTAVAVVTGGSRGIGAATAHALAAQGWDLCLAYREAAGSADEVASACTALGRRALAVRADVTSAQDVVELFAAAAELGPVRAVVNNAGVVDRPARVDEMDVTRLQPGHAVAAVENITGKVVAQTAKTPVGGMRRLAVGLTAALAMTASVAVSAESIATSVMSVLGITAADEQENQRGGDVVQTTVVQIYNTCTQAALPAGPDVDDDDDVVEGEVVEDVAGR